MNLFRLHCQKFHKFYTLLFLTSLLLWAVACTTAWTSEATNIIGLLVPAIQAVLGILGAFGAGLAPSVMTQVQTWANQAVNDLNNIVKPLIDKYNAAEAGAKPGILTEISNAVGTIVSGLNLILPALHVSDPATQSKVTTIATLVLDELQALLNLIPAIQGTVNSHAELKKLISALKSPDEFRTEFNNVAGTFGSEFEI